MTRIVINQFSCLELADITISDLTILIGPQASGKSIISKLTYFFINILAKQYICSEEQMPYKEFGKSIVEDFKKWFPPATWGKKKFSIEFTQGPVAIKILRTVAGGRPGQNIKVQLSEFIVDGYNLLLAAYAQQLKQEEKRSSASGVISLESSWRIQSAIRKRLASAIGPDYVDGQTFIPAGRSFFTSFGKAVTAFEQGGLLDPITVRFGRLFARLRDRIVRYYPAEKEEKISRSAREALGLELFGGKIQADREKEFVESVDGRKVPFSLLSSGQQELLPLWLALEDIIKSRRRDHLIYIEEPEAHLFPSAQERLAEYLAGLVSQKMGRRLLITSHSPYLLAKINNLLKAGTLAAKVGKSGETKIIEIIKREYWLEIGHVTAYAIIDKQTKKIMDDDGLIDGDYLDAISGKISSDFLRLLEIESKLQ